MQYCSIEELLHGANRAPRNTTRLQNGLDNLMKKQANPYDYIVPCTAVFVFVVGFSIGKAILTLQFPSQNKHL